MKVQYNLAFHELTKIVPLMEGEAFEELVADIKEKGLIEPIVLLDGQILDGRNRYRACKKADVELSIVEWIGKDDPLDYVVSRNVMRRHLTPSQKAMAAAKIANLKHGGDRKSEDFKGSCDPLISTAGAAKRVGASEATTKRARVVLEHGTPEQVAAVEAGELTVATAVKQIGDVSNGLSPNTTPEQPRQQRLARGEKKAKDRFERFMNVTEGLGQLCHSVNEMEVPILSHDAAAERLTYLKQARRDLSKLIKRLSELAQ